ncbi:MAG: GtrA family protein [Roseibium album]|uniref:GtrA-like protein n=1 Tax=Roseibium album TaxID=311410 RepID=A0A0M6ZVQ9_9HYPH|nr:GtrA family protein [Roseibium album]MBG6157209.1 putative flippase GtrA [Labrenzia sp. EL_162]MBG6177764.1 putative flippase GtrA [Labrenzia sp. EL_132]MBG6196397.1 putative flippase GtrA [Labrenzia sp. EL_159]MBG6232502.1 putative flippase GtrA [Labrenzia sp. EL_208]MCR9059929.1 GtrA family protein [Paracoccaceae bacterium]
MLAKVNLEKLKAESAAVGKFAVIGVIATLTHAIVASTLFEAGILSVVPSNVCGFLTAFAVSFSGHYFWSFSHLRQTGTALKSMTRFLVVSIAGFALNSTILTLWLTFTSWPELYGLWLAILIVPAFSFVGARLWAFAHPSAKF